MSLACFIIHVRVDGKLIGFHGHYAAAADIADGKPAVDIASLYWILTELMVDLLMKPTCTFCCNWYEPRYRHWTVAIRNSIDKVSVLLTTSQQ